MKYFLDTEFNETRGELISIGIVSENGEREFYAVLKHDDGKATKWVRQNIYPLLSYPDEDYEIQDRLKVQLALNEFFIEHKYHEAPTIIADWPADIWYFCDLMLTDEGKKIMVGNFNFSVDRRLSCAGAKIRHNALSDARALRLDYLRLQKEDFENDKYA